MALPQWNSHTRELATCLCGKNWQTRDLPAALVFSRADGLLGSPTPTLLLATTRNSYSTQGLKSTTVALWVLPLTTSGTEGKINMSLKFIFGVINSIGKKIQSSSQIAHLLQLPAIQLRKESSSEYCRSGLDCYYLLQTSRTTQQ